MRPRGNEKMLFDLGAGSMPSPPPPEIGEVPLTTADLRVGQGWKSSWTNLKISHMLFSRDLLRESFVCVCVFFSRMRAASFAITLAQNCWKSIRGLNASD